LNLIILVIGTVRASFSARRYAMTRSRTIVGVLAASLVLSGTIALCAEPAGLRVSPFDRLRAREVSPSDAGARGNVPERQLFEPSSALPPAFVTPLTKQTGSGRIGVAGWGVPETPGPSRSAGDLDGGWVGFGIAGEWWHPGRGRN
jgi:hypothetical protein